MLLLPQPMHTEHKSGKALPDFVKRSAENDVTWQKMPPNYIVSTMGERGGARGEQEGKTVWRDGGRETGGESWGESMKKSHRMEHSARVGNTREKQVRHTE